MLPQTKQSRYMNNTDVLDLVLMVLMHNDGTIFRVFLSFSRITLNILQPHSVIDRRFFGVTNVIRYEKNVQTTHNIAT